MAQTNFNALTTEEKTVWSRQVWKQARNASFTTRFMGNDENSVIQRVTELTKDERGARAVITLVTDLEDDGVAGDTFLEGREEAINAYDQVITIDQLRHAVRSKGRMAEQRSVVNFRSTARNRLAYYYADRMDQLAFLTMSGIDYSFKLDGSVRNSSDLPNLEYAADVTAPTARRHYRWDNTAKTLLPGNTAAVAAGDTLTYAALLCMKATASKEYIRPVGGEAGNQMFHVFVSPDAMKSLKLDPDYLANVRNAAPRSKSHDLFKGTGTIEVDGMMISETRYAYTNIGAPAGQKWGAAGDVEGTRVIFAGAQALAVADLGLPHWEEKSHDYNNQPAIAIGKMCGFLKPKFKGVVDRTEQDHGLMVIDVANA